MEDKKKEKVVKGRSTKSKVMTVMLGVAFFCVLSFLLLAIFDDGTIMRGKSNQEPPTNNEQKEPSNKEDTNKGDSYVGKYVALGEGNEQDKEYFELFEDGKATIYAITGDNGLFEEISTHYNITTEEETTVLIFDEYNTEIPGNWYTYPLDLTKTETGYKAIPSGYNNKCTGPSACNITFEK